MVIRRPISRPFLCETLPVLAVISANLSRRRNDPTLRDLRTGLDVHRAMQAARAEAAANTCCANARMACTIQASARICCQFFASGQVTEGSGRLEGLEIVRRPRLPLFKRLLCRGAHTSRPRRRNNLRITSLRITRRALSDRFGPSKQTSPSNSSVPTRYRSTNASIL